MNRAYVGGVSGGHIIPARTLAQEYYADHPSTRCLFFSAATPLDYALLAGHPWLEHHPLQLDQIPRTRFIFGILPVCWQYVRAWWQAFRLLRAAQITRVIATGGAVSIPVCIAAWMLRIPIEIHELNATPGAAVRFLAPLATRIVICFASAHTHFKKYPVMMTAYPLHTRVRMTRAAAREKLGIADSMHVVAVLGGSQGSQALNSLASSALVQLAQTQLHVLHQTGAKDCEMVTDVYRTSHVHAIVEPLTDQVMVWYAAADLIIARAGAGTLFEIMAHDVPAIIVPLVTQSNDHQQDNARAAHGMAPRLIHVVEQKAWEQEPAMVLDLMRALLRAQVVQTQAKGMQPTQEYTQHDAL